MLKFLRSPESDSKESIPQGIDSASLCSLVKIDSLELIPGLLKSLQIRARNEPHPATPFPPAPPPRVSTEPLLPPHPKIGTYFATKK
jgi:hypothetical protein